MERSVQDLIDEGKFDNEDFTNVEIDIANNDLTILKGIENFTNLRIINARYNKLTSIKELNKFTNLSELDVSHNNLESLIGIETLESLDWIWYLNNPCSQKYFLYEPVVSKRTTAQKFVKLVQKEVWIKDNLNKDSSDRGKAVLIHSGLFDFKNF